MERTEASSLDTRTALARRPVAGEVVVMDTCDNSTIPGYEWHSSITFGQWVAVEDSNECSTGACCKVVPWVPGAMCGDIV